MQPKISIVLPVYNVEQYLRQCLDSIVNQTMQEIQIICVNDGSPDGSRAILQEHADRDSRIEIIDKPNGGLSSARNAAYPSIKGKYTLFVDSDDWIELDLCEKTYRKAEATGAQMTVFFYQGEQGQNMQSYWQVTHYDKMTVEEKLSIADYPSAWSKLWRTDFLLDNNLHFPEGLKFEDLLVHWQALTLADKISVVPEYFYHYRYNPDSIMQQKWRYWRDLVLINDKICAHLFESGHYAGYRNKFILQTLNRLHWHYCGLPATMKPEFIAVIRESLTTDNREFYRTAPKALLSKTVRLFYEMIDGGSREATNYHVSQAVRSIVRMPERLLRTWIIKPIKKRLRAA